MGPIQVNEQVLTFIPPAREEQRSLNPAWAKPWTGCTASAAEAVVET